MPQPDTTVRPDLGIAIEDYSLEMAQSRFIGTMLFPIFGTQLKAADFSRINIADLLKDGEVDRAPRSAYNRGTYGFTQDSYTCTEKGHEEPVDESEARQYATYFDAEATAARIGMGIVLRKQEKRIADLCAAHTVTSNVSNAWSSAANATPKADVTTALKSIRDNTGMKGDTVTMSYTTYKNLMATTEIKEALKYTESFALWREEQVKTKLADYFDVRRVLIGDAVRNTANEGQTASLSGIWPDAKVFVSVTAESPDLKEPCAGRTILWTADSPDNATVESYYENQTRSNIIRVRQHTHEKVHTSACLYVLGNIA